MYLLWFLLTREDGDTAVLKKDGNRTTESIHSGTSKEGKNKYCVSPHFLGALVVK